MADNEDIINCPACGKRMKKIYMPKQGVHLDVCIEGCGGIYFDNREFKMFNKSTDDIEPLKEAYKNAHFIEVDENDLRICPVCGMKMVKNRARENRSVQVDDCYGCGGKFLDYCELDKIRSGQYKQINYEIPSNLKTEQFRALSEIIDLEPESAGIFYYDDKKRTRKNITISFFAGVTVALLTFGKFKMLHLYAAEYGLKIPDIETDILVCLVIIAFFVFLGVLFSKRI